MTISSSPKQNGHYEMGDILLLEGGGVIVFRQPVPDKNYDFTYQLVADGRFEARAIAMGNQKPRKLGRVDSEYMRRLIREKKWDRQEMTVALQESDFAQWLPVEDGRVELAGVVAGNGKISLSRGTRIVIKNGQHAWQAVYWGAGGNGEDILAHKAGQSWHLTNMSLKNYGDKLEVGEPAPDNEIDEIMECVLAAE